MSIKYGDHSIGKAGIIMGALGIQITDMAGAYIEHSIVITNFVAIVRNQLKKSLCRVFPGNVQYRWNVGGEEKNVIPDATINCQIKAKRGNYFINAPRFVMEVLSDSTEKYDRTTKKEIYQDQDIDEYWIVDWKRKKVEIYTLDYEKEQPRYFPFKEITEQNKEELKIVHFPNVKIDFDDLFDGIDCE